MAGSEEDRQDFGELYPFLYSDEADLDSVLEEVARSTQEKAEEIIALRERVWEELGQEIIACAEDMAARFAGGGKLFTCGNGGSSTDAHAVSELFLHPPAGRPVPALNLTADVAVVTALSNDVGFDVIFARQIAVFGDRGDVVMGLSTSGNSGNVIRAFEEANRAGLVTVGLAGYDGGQMADSEAIDHLLVVPSDSVHRIQEAQTTVYHLLWELTQEALSERHPTAASG